MHHQDREMFEIVVETLAKLRWFLGYKPRIRLEEGIRRLLQGSGVKADHEGCHD
jgi:hypothetical protein